MKTSFKNPRIKVAFVLLLFVIVACQCVPLFGPPVPQNSAPGFNPAYADTDGDGFVPPAGDALYDEHYAKNVNNPNANALETLADKEKKLAEARVLEEQRKKLATENQFMAFLRWIFIIIFAIVVAIIIYGLTLGRAT